MVALGCMVGDIRSSVINGSYTKKRVGGGGWRARRALHLCQGAFGEEVQLLVQRTQARQEVVIHIALKAAQSIKVNTRLLTAGDKN